jgi:hypothetical protein
VRHGSQFDCKRSRRGYAGLPTNGNLTGAIGPMKFKFSSVIIPFITGGSSLTVVSIKQMSAITSGRLELVVCMAFGAC